MNDKQFALIGLEKCRQLPLNNTYLRYIERAIDYIDSLDDKKGQHD